MFLQYSRFGGVGLLLHECWVNFWGLFSAYKFEIKWSILPLAVSSGSADLEVLAVKAVRQVKRVEVEDITEWGARLFSSQFLVLWHRLRRWETTSRWSWLMQYPASKDGRTGSIWNILSKAFPRQQYGQWKWQENSTPMPQGLTLPRMQRLIDIMDSVQLRCNLASWRRKICIPGP